MTEQSWEAFFDALMLRDRMRHLAANIRCAAYLELARQQGMKDMLSELEDIEYPSEDDE